MNTYVTVCRIDHKAVVKVRFHCGLSTTFPLTKAGCRLAGKALYDAGEESWMNSSSVDFPGELGKRYASLDVRELMSEAFQAELEKAGAPRKRLIAKMIARCSQKDFQATLDDEERVAFATIRKTER